MERSRTAAKMAASLIAALAIAGCGFEEDKSVGSGPTVTFYAFNEPGGAFEKALNDCSEQSNGRYSLEYNRLPTDADQQRELVVRRLAAEDSDIDIIGMDVIWTAEFAEAGWILPWEGERAAEARKGKLDGPLRTAEYNGQLWAAPFTTNTQLLWYRKDRVKELPKNYTWDDLIDIAHENGSSIEVQAARYEGYTVWVNSLIASAGGSLVDEQGNVKVDDSAERAAEIIKRVADEAAPAGMSNNKEDQARLGFESGRSDFEVNYTFVWASAGELGGDFQKNMGYARYPRVDSDKPSRVTLGGINLGIGAYSKHPDLAFEAAQCLANPENQIVAAELGGLAPTTEALYDDPKVKKAFPFGDLMRQSLDEGVPRPVTPAYADVSLAIQKTFHPPDGIDPGSVVDELRDKLDKAAEGKIF
jgi:multiple sugar transport system substrate-binding protein